MLQATAEERPEAAKQQKFGPSLDRFRSVTCAADMLPPPPWLPGARGSRSQRRDPKHPCC